MKNIILAAAAACSISAAQAQVTISPVGGLNMSNYTMKSAGTGLSSDLKLKMGPCIGAFVDIPRLSLQTGLFYKLNGFRAGYYYTSAGPTKDDYQSLRVSTLEIPFKFRYVFNLRNGSGIFIGAGPYVAVNIAASTRLHAYQRDIAGNPVNIFDTVIKRDIGQPGIKRIDVGAGINVGYQAAKGFMLCLQGQYGALNHGNEHNEIHNYNFGIVAGYTFKMKKKAHKEEPAAHK